MNYKDVVTPLVKPRWSLAYATGVRVTGGIDSLTLDFHHRRQGGYSVHC